MSTDEMDPRQVDLVLYHAQCLDGFGAAWSAHEKVATFCGFQAVTHGEPPPAVAGRRVAILDFSYDRDTMLQLADEASGIIVLDHHVTAQKELEGLPFAHFDMDKSGAMLSWEWFHPDEPAPKIVQYVQDHDLWHHELPHSERVIAALRAVPYDLEAWTRFAIELGTRFGDVVARGDAIMALDSLRVQRLAKTAVRASLGRTRLWLVNATDHFSELGNYLALQSEEGVAAIWRVDHASNSIVVSLRAVSRANVDVSMIAKGYGGGGHRLAAGFSVPLDFALFPFVVHEQPDSEAPIPWAQRGEP